MTIGLNLSFLPPAAAMASVQQTPTCAWGCAFPMQPIPDGEDAWRCTGCGSIALREPATGEREAHDAIAIADALGGSIEQLKQLVELLAGYTADTVLPAGAPLVSFKDAVALEFGLRRVLGLLRSEPMVTHADAVHAIAIEAAARICEFRASSLFSESKNAFAAVEAEKCATAVRRLWSRDVLAERPELVAPLVASAIIVDAVPSIHRTLTAEGPCLSPR